MGKTSKSRATVQIRGVAESRLRTEQKMSDHSRHDPQTLLTKQNVREYLEAFLCPWCARGPFKSVANHVSRAHGVGPKELRDLAGLYYKDSLSDPETREKRANAQRGRDMDAVRAARKPEHLKRAEYSKEAQADKSERLSNRVLSDAAKERNRRQLEAIRGVGLAAAAKASKEAALRRFEAAKPVILKAYETESPLSAVADELGVSRAQVGRWAKRMGMPDGRALAAKWREFPQDAISRGSEERLERKRAEDAAEWENSDKSWAYIDVMAEARGMSPKTMVARLRSIGIDPGDGRILTTKKRKPRSVPLPCSVEGCARSHVALGLCRYHWQKHRIAQGIFKPCCKPECEKPVVARGLCSTHYARERNNQARH